LRVAPAPNPYAILLPPETVVKPVFVIQEEFPVASDDRIFPRAGAVVILIDEAIIAPAENPPSASLFTRVFDTANGVAAKIAAWELSNLDAAGIGLYAINI
jgi:hypothetical protein